MIEKAKNLIARGRSTTAKTFTRFSNRGSRHATAGKQAREGNHLALLHSLSKERRVAHHNPSCVARIATLVLCTLAILFGASAQAALAEEPLPDGRVYEMVTPAENQDANVYVPYAPDEQLSQGIETFFPFQVSPDGGSVTYIADATTGGEGITGKGVGDQYLARRLGGGGWAQSVIQPKAYPKTYFQGFSGELSVGVLDSGSSAEPKLPPLTASAPPKGYSVLYARNDSADEGDGGEALYQPFFANPLAFNHTAKEFGTNEEVNDENKSGKVPVFAGGTSDFEKMFFEANDDLTSPNDPLRPTLDKRVKEEITKGEDNDYLYDSVAGTSYLVDVLPEGEVAPNATFGGPPLASGNAEKNPPDFGGVVSPEGNFVYWTEEPSDRIYVRVNGEVTVAVSAGAAQYWGSGDGGRYAFYVEGGELLRYDALSETSEALTAPSAGVKGVLGVSEDGESVYAVTSGVLAGSGPSGEGAMPVEDPGVTVNLYLLRRGSTPAWSAPVFIATLSEQDGTEAQPMRSAFGVSSGIEFGDWQPGLGHRTAGVSGGGGSVVFMSDERLPVVGFPGGYPNGPVGGGSDEVYLFQAGVDRLFCVSCSASGESLGGGGAAGFLPVSWSDVHLPEWVADEGNRVFFDSDVPLVAQDTNGRQDVYEWEREGTGGCTSATAVNGGCIYLLSGGTSDTDSWFIGASESGNDVFVVTRAQLTSDANNETFKLFDARVGGVQPVTPPACTGTGCQGAPEAAPTFATPPSVTFNGPGNFPPPTPATAPPAKPKPKAKTLTKSQKLAKALKACAKQPRGATRKNCVAAARRQYGSPKQGKR